MNKYTCKVCGNQTFTMNRAHGDLDLECVNCGKVHRFKEVVHYIDDAQISVCVASEGRECGC